MNEVVLATLRHAEDLAPRMRKADIDEVRASSGETPLEALIQSIAMSPMSWAWKVDGRVIAIFGVAPHPNSPAVGIPWLLGCPEVEQQKIHFLRQCRGYLKQMLDAFPVLTNYVDCRHTASIQWLSWCGFALCEVEPFYGAQRLPFIRFAMARGAPHV